MDIVRFIINRKVFISMLFIGMCLLGLVSYYQLPVELLPNTEMPYLIVSISGAQDTDPGYIEKKAVIPVEGVVSTLEGIDKIESFADRGRSTVFVYFNPSVNIKYAYLRLEERLTAVKSELEDEFFINVMKIDTEQLANMFMTLQVRGSGGLERVRAVIDQKILDELSNIDGMANVEVLGGQQQSIEVIVSEDAGKAYDITPATIRQLISRNNQYKSFVGHVYQNDLHYFVNVTADYTKVADIENIIVDANGPVFLKDIADVYFGLKQQETISRVNGKEAITLQLVRDTQVNLIDLSRHTRGVIDDLNKKLKNDDIEIVIQTDSAELVETNIDLIKELALTGGLMAILVLWIFLRNLRMVIIIALAIPVSVITAFNLFYAFDISINSLTLVGMALAIGMLLDNAVVVLENIYRLYANKQDPENAVIKGTNQVWRSIFAATLTTVTVFLPFIFASNIFVKLLGRHVGVSIIATLGVSLVVALLLIPMATHFILTHSKNTKPTHFVQISMKNRMFQIYNVLLKSCLRYPARTIILTVVAFFVTLLISLAVSINVGSETETAEINMYVTMPSGSTLESTDLLVAKIEEQLENLEEKQDVISKIYEEEAILTIILKEDYFDIKQRPIPQIKDDIDESIDRMRLRVADISFTEPSSSSRFRGGGGGRNPGASFERMLGIGGEEERIEVKGSDFQVMRNIADDLVTYLEDLTSIDRASESVSDNRPEIHLLLDKNILSFYDVPLSAVSSELSAFQQEFSANVNYKTNNEEYDIVIRSDNIQERTFEDLQNLQVPSSSGGNYELRNLSQIIYSEGLAGINRVNQEKLIEVNYRFIDQVLDSKDYLTDARYEIDQLVANLQFPTGVAVEIIHEDLGLDDFYFLIAAAFILIFMILASVFESISTPLVMMFTIPLAAVGSLWALIFTGNSVLNANTLIGFLILLGVVVNNGIIFIDYTRLLMRQNYSQTRALLMAGQARTRPILITAITTIIAMLPLAMGKAEYVSQIGAPFAITVIGGLSLSTLFTLVFIPTAYVGLQTSIDWFNSLNWKIKGLQIILLSLGFWLVYINVSSIIWRLIDIFILLFVIPAMTLFILTSLRRANAEMIQSDEKITIKIRHLVKVYDDYSRFSREWSKGKKIREKAGIYKSYKTRRDLESLIWELPLLTGLVYFTYFYLSSAFWMFVLSHFVYFFAMSVLKPLLARWENAKTDYILKFAFWFLPLFNLLYFFLKWKNLVLVIFIGIVWYLALAIFTTSNRLHRDKVDIVRIQGKFKGIRKNFYRLVQFIPVIGRKKNPFRALDGISMEIGSGMFGLLGPNGAGKTTLMRIICGILDQSRGRIWINEYNINEKREELQGLIGYLPQEFGMYENMTAFEFLNYQAILKGLYDQKERLERIEYVLKAVHMIEHQHKKIESFSGGMKQRVGIAQTLLHLPRILVVDEPTAGLDPRERIRFRNLLVDLARERIVIFSTHIIEDIASSCNKVAVMHRGQLRYLGAPMDMVTLAEKHIWQYYITPAEFKETSEKYTIIHHMRVEDKIRIRCLSDTAPAVEAVNVQPTLEDAYLWLLQYGKH